MRKHILHRCGHGDMHCMRLVRKGKVYKKKYMQSMLGKVNFVLSINPKDNEFVNYKMYLKSLV